MTTRPLVLVAGDSEGILGPAAASLEASGFEAVPVQAPEILDTFRAGRPPSLVLVDEAFGTSGGVALCRELRSDPFWRAVSLMLAVPAGEQHLEECLVAGINDFLLAPFPAGELIAKARRLTSVTPRRPATGLVSIRGGRPDGAVVTGRTLNVSCNGLLVEVETLLGVGRTVEAIFFLPDGGPPVSARARVVRRASERAQYHSTYGLEFEGLPGGEAERIRLWVGLSRTEP